MSKKLFNNNNSFFNFTLLFSFGVFGFSALIFQIIFARNLIPLFGLTAPAIATVLAVFFFGLALGSLVFGKISDRLSETKNFKLYIPLFVVTAVYGFLFPALFKFLNFSISAVNKIYPLNFTGFNFVAFFFAFVVLVIPAIFIGAGFPLVNKILVRRENEIGRKIALSYFVNTFGSVLGAASAGFWLIPAFGNNATIFIAAGLNLITAGFLFSVSGRIVREPAEKETREDAGESVIGDKIFLYVLFATGFLALALEVVYTKTLILFIGSSTYAFSVITAVFLLGIAVGSWLAAFFVDRIMRGSAYFGIFLGLIGFWLFVTAQVFNELPFWYLQIFKTLNSLDFSAVLVSQFSLVALVILPVTVLMGLVFPLGIKLAGLATRQLSAGIGKLYFANILGGVFGSLAAGFWLLSGLGYQKTMFLIMSAYFVVGIIFIIRERNLAPSLKGIFAFFFIFWVVFSVFFTAWTRTATSFGVFPYATTYASFDKSDLLSAADKDEIIFYKEGQSNVAVIRRGGELLLRINGKTDASNTLGDTEAQILIGALPMLLHPEPKDVLAIGLGSGITLGAITQFEEARNIEAVEIDPSVVEAAGYFKEYNHDAASDPRVKIILADGRNYLRLTDKKYDVISSEPSNLWVSGNAYLFTKEFYELAKSRLKGNGIILQWLHLYSLDLAGVQSVLKTFSSVFPNAYLFETISGGDLLIVGQMRPEPILNFDLLEKKFGDQKIRQELERIYIFSPYDFVPYLIADARGIADLSDGAEINSDDRPFLEFSSPKAIYYDTASRTIQDLADIQQENNPLITTIGGDTDKLKKYFIFSQKLFPFRIANIEGDLFAAIDRYNDAKGEGPFQYLAETYILKRCNFVAQITKQTKGEDAANQIWERCNSVFNEVVIK